MKLNTDRTYRTQVCNTWEQELLLLFLAMYSLIGCSKLSSRDTSFKGQGKLLAIQNIQGDLVDLIKEAEKNMPKTKSEGFIVPSKPEELAFQNIFLAINKNKPDEALKLALSYNYEIIKLSDQEDFGTENFILREQLPIKKGWGLYVFRIKYTQNIIIEAPHPVTDEHTPEVALDIYRALNAKALLVAGALRDANQDGSSDSAHATESIFQTLHVALFQSTQQLDKTIFLQIHGFASSGHPHYPKIVIGHNWTNDPNKDHLLQLMADNLQNNNITVGICDDNNNYPDLCGRKNLQSSVTDGGAFIHIELSANIRRDDSSLVNALKKAFSQYYQ